MANLEKPITTQEELDAFIRDRLTRDREAQAKRYEGWQSPEAVEKAAKEAQARQDELTAQLAEIKKQSEASGQQIADLKAQNHRYEIASVKTKVAHEVGLDWSFAERLSGETEDEIRADAESLKGLIGTQNTQKAPPPLLNYESTETGKNDAWNSMLSKLRG